MCARYKLVTPTGVIVEDFHIRSGRPNLEARYNIAPSQSVPIVRDVVTRGMSVRQLDLLRWGLVPGWAKDAKIGFSTINARAETVAEKPAFRDALRRRRCLVPADGYYEWRSEHSGKQPYLFKRRDSKIMAFAGLWERWERGGEPLESFTIIVTEANDLARPVHDRMPVIIEPAHFDRWLDAGRYGPTDILPLLTPFASDLMEMKAVSRRLNSVANEGPELMIPEPQTLMLI
jgi:putative SOS response-associated peptidase YedK